jgi:hypothetical protein
MSRYVFTRQDLEPLRSFLGLPGARQALQAAVPIKRFAPAQVQERLPLEVDVRSREKPDGVPLEAILDEAKKASPSITGIAVRGNAVVFTHSREQKPEEKVQLDRLLKDKTRLTKLGQIARAERPAVLRTAARPARSDGELEALRERLLDDATPDDQWLRAFRRYATQVLLKEP